MSTQTYIERKPAPDITHDTAEEQQPRQFDFSADRSSLPETQDVNWQTQLNQTERLGHTLSQVPVHPAPVQMAPMQTATHQPHSFQTLVQPKVVNEEQRRDEKRETMMRAGIIK